MATIMCLPDEVIYVILSDNDLSVEDIVNFRCVWMQLRSRAKHDKYWETIFLYKRWPSAKKLYDKQTTENERKDSKENEQKDIKSLNFIKTGINIARQLRRYVSQIISKNYYDNKPIVYYYNISMDNNLIKHEDEFYLDEHLRNNFDEIIFKPENILKYSFFIDEIKYLLTQSPRRTGCDLTERYCNIKIMHYLRQRSLKKEWDEYKKKPDREQLLERAATIVAQWVQPEKDVFYSCIKASLDSMALEVLNCLREKHPNHSIFSTPDETFSYWKNNNIDDNHWNEAEGTQIMDILQKYIFGKLNFRPDKSIKNLETTCIDNVLKNKYGRDIILYVIYHSVARRLGLRCDIISQEFDNIINLELGPLYIFWKPKYATHNLENIRCFTLRDVKKFPDCFVNKVPLFRAPSSFINKMWYEIRGMFENMMFSWNNNIFGLTYDEFRIRSYPKLNLRFKKGAMIIPRSEDLKFAVGMIVTHRDQSTDSCTGVIIGWHRLIDRHFQFSIEDVLPSSFLDIGLLPLNRPFHTFRQLQTNYIILTDKNEMCYVEEDTITLTTPKWIENSEIGRYFYKFEGTYYVPNKMLARLYPQDAAITAAITAKSEN